MSMDKRIIAFAASSSRRSINKRLVTYAAGLLPGAEVAVFDDASHITFAEKRAEYIALMRDFIARVE